MKTLLEVEQWRLGATAQFGDPSEVTGQLFARFIPRLPDRPYADVIAAYEDEALLLSFEIGQIFPLLVDMDGISVDPNGALRVFGIEKVCPGVWNLKPSLNIPGVIHAFVTIYDVPLAAPWEHKIIVVSSLSQAIGRSG